jgi:hypothetical protein
VGELSSQFAWARVAQFAFAGQDRAAAENAVSILLNDMFIAALGLQGGGTLLAIAERHVVAEAADQLAGGLDRAIAGVLGGELAGMIGIVLYFGLREGGSHA